MTARPRPNERPTTHRTDQRTATLGHHIERITALHYQTAWDHIHEELRRSDGYTTPSDTRTGNGTPDPTSRIAEERCNLHAYLADLTEWRTYLADTIKAGETLMRRITGARIPEPPPAQCRDSLHGLELSPELTAAIATCYELPTKGGHCGKHYQAIRRERIAAGRDVSNMHEPGRP